MRIFHGCTKTMLRSTSGSPELMSESARTAVSGSPTKARAEIAGTATTAKPAKPMAEILVQALRLRGLAARCRMAKPAMDTPIIASPIGCTHITAQQTNAKHQKYVILPHLKKATAKARAMGRKRNLAAVLSS